MKRSHHEKTQYSRDSKTVLIGVNIGFSARYLLRTDILERLKQAGVRVVILAPNADEPYFREEFESQGVVVEQYEFEKCRQYLKNSRLQRFLRTVRWYTMPNATKRSALNARFEAFRNESLEAGFTGRLSYYIVALFKTILSRSSLLRRAMLYLEVRLFVGGFHRQVFKKYRPALLVTTSLGYFDFDQYIMREAGKYGVKVVAVILSWDNSSSKGLAGAKADAVIAWTEAMKQELIKYYEIPPERIFVGGVAHFDTYFRPNFSLSREALFAKYGMDPKRKLIFFGTRSPNKFPWTSDCIRVLADAIEKDLFSYPCQLLVRLHPNHYQMRDGKYRYRTILDKYEEIKQRRRWVFFNEPRILSSKLTCDMPRFEMIELGSILKHADVLVNYYSTLMLEASIFDLPIVNFVKYGHNVLLGKENRSVMNFEHIRRIIERKAEVTATTDKELIEVIDEYLLRPDKDREARRQVTLEECGYNQGRAGEAIANQLLSLLAGSERLSESLEGERDGSLVIDSG